MELGRIIWYNFWNKDSVFQINANCSYYNYSGLFPCYLEGIDMGSVSVVTDSCAKKSK